MHVSLLPVFSKLAAPSRIPAAVADVLPPGWQLSQHQLETYQALVNPTVDVVINTAMTGDGKSLAGLLPLLVEKNATMALYPTKELIYDQHGSATQVLEHWKRPTRWIETLDSPKLHQKTEELEHTRRGDVIEQMFMHRKLILSNPDIFHAIMQFFYQQPGRAPDWLAGRVGDMFQQLTFDEFHIFELPQVVSVLTALLFLQVQAPQRITTLFLSATPRNFLLELLQRAGLRCHQVETASTYYHGEHPGMGWRRILHGCELHVDTTTAEAWVEAHLEDVVLPFFRHHGPGAKGAIIVNSVAAVHRLVARLQPRFAQEGLVVLPNTALTERETRRKSYNADLLIATSTVDVGVDFQINFLVFEASSAGHFLQRLGRLGRHSSYSRDGMSYPFDTFYACALVPKFVAERLFDGYGQEPALLKNGATISRQTLQEALATAYPELATFPGYVRHWGRFQPAYVLAMLQSSPIRDSYAGVWEQLKQRYETTFGIKLREARDVGKRMLEEGRGLLMEEARSFRGRSPFACGVLPMKERDKPAEPQTYDLFWLLANANLELLEEDDFMASVSAHAEYRCSLRRAKPVVYFRLHGYRQERTDLVVRLPRAITEWGSERHHQAQVVQGITVETPGFPQLNLLNRCLERRIVVGILIPGPHPLDVRRVLRLPLLFPLYRYTDLYNRQGTIAFARQALMLDTALRHRNLWQESGGMPIIV